jgi:hypothetical protein
MSPITLTLTKTHQNTTTIKQSRVKRDWMDNTHNKHAYQCMPMTLANVYGWEVQIEEDVVVQWDNEQSAPRILQGEYTSTGRRQAVSSITGMISLNVGWAINTDEGYSTWFTGSPNYFHDGAIPLTATLPTSWWPDETQMNWKLTKIGEPITFKAGDPFCFFTVYDNRVVENVDIKVKNLWEDKELLQSRMNYSDLKIKNMKDKPWEWTKGIKTGIDADGKQIGPSFSGLPKLSEPSESSDVSSFSTDYLLKTTDVYLYELTFHTPLGDETHHMRINGDKSIDLLYLNEGGQYSATVGSLSASISSSGSVYSQNINATFDLDVPMTTRIHLELLINSGSGRVQGEARIGDFAQIKVTGKKL